MSNAEWPPVDPNQVSLPTIVSSTDLFDGELFGDELIDIYNSAVVGDENHDVIHHEIPHLLGHDDDNKKKDEILHPGAQMAVNAAAIDDGFGAFRPSTSFNDLSTLLSPAAEAESTTTGPSTAALAASAKAVGSAKGTKKRSGAASDAPAPKRRASAPKGSRKPAATKKQGTAAPAAATKTRPAVTNPPTPKEPVSSEQPTADTPNPLSAPDAETAPPLKEALKSIAKPPANVKRHVSAEKVAPTLVTDSTSSSGSVSGTTSSGNVTGTTEADFKAIAQAAVSSLIMSAGTGKTEAPASPAEATKTSEPVDISTAHIKALTGNNWVAACSGATAAVTSVSSANDPKNNNRARRQNLTPDERARQNRDRNREHARNTRLRKKAYVEELKRTLTELVTQRDATEFEKRQEAQREVEQREVRFRVIEEFLKLRGRNEVNVARWAAILEEGFSLAIPVTEFRKMVEKEASSAFEQVLEGVSEVMVDAANFHAFLQSLVKDSKEAITFQYVCDRKNFFMDGCNAVLEWTATSVGAIAQGASAELSLKGIFRGKFSPASNKLLSANMSFDTATILSQLRNLHLADSKEPSNAETRDEVATAAAAQAAASQADAILDSLHLSSVPVPAAVTVVPNSSSSCGSEASSENGECSSDESVGENEKTASTVQGMTTRRVQRRSK